MPTFPDRTRSTRATPSHRSLAMFGITVAVAATFALNAIAPSPAGAVGPTIPKRTTPTTAKPAAKPAGKKSSTAKATVKKPVVRKASTGSATAKRRSTVSSGLGTGSSGAAVTELQELLAERHYDVPVADGNYGGGTYHAVMALQKAWGLPRTGRATTAVLDQLRSGEDPEPIVPNGGATRVEIDLPRQALFLYENGNLTKILSISSGNNEKFCEPDPDQGGKVVCDVAKTPGGSFRVNNRILGFRESRLGAMFNPMYFNGGIAMHGSQSVPAGPASHGCVRVTMSSSERLFDQVQLGTAVYVYDGKTIPKALADRSRPATTTSTTTSTTLPGITSSIPTTVPTTVPNTTPPPPTSVDPAATTTTLVTTSTILPTPGDTTTTTVVTTVPGTTTTTTSVSTTLPGLDTTTTTSTIPILPGR
jgi:peptidoglycan hydrolase-like protein with peptidoglycan-binding domain